MKQQPQPGTQDAALEALVTAARTLAPDQLPVLIGRLEEVKAHALARLAAPAPVPSEPDESWTVKRTAAFLGMGWRTLYNQHDRYPFSLLKQPRVNRSVRFSSRKVRIFKQAGIEALKKYLSSS